MFYGPPGHGSLGASCLCPINIPSLWRAVIPINPLLNTHTRTHKREMKSIKKKTRQAPPTNAVILQVWKTNNYTHIQICMYCIFMILMKYLRHYSHLVHKHTEWCFCLSDQRPVSFISLIFRSQKLNEYTDLQSCAPSASPLITFILA